jgi:hypothetical protein
MTRHRTAWYRQIISTTFYVTQSDAQSNQLVIGRLNCVRLQSMYSDICADFICRRTLAIQLTIGQRGRVFDADQKSLGELTSIRSKYVH